MITIVTTGSIPKRYKFIVRMYTKLSFIFSPEKISGITLNTIDVVHTTVIEIWRRVARLFSSDNGFLTAINRKNTSKATCKTLEISSTCGAKNIKFKYQSFNRLPKPLIKRKNVESA